MTRVRSRRIRAVSAITRASLTSVLPWPNTADARHYPGPARTRCWPLVSRTASSSDADHTTATAHLDAATAQNLRLMDGPVWALRPAQDTIGRLSTGRLAALDESARSRQVTSIDRLTVV